MTILDFFRKESDEEKLYRQSKKRFSKVFDETEALLRHYPRDEIKYKIYREEETRLLNIIREIERSQSA